MNIHEEDDVLPNVRYTFAIPVLSEEQRRIAAGAIRTISGDEVAQEFLRPTYDVVYVRDRREAKLLADRLMREVPRQRGFDFETSGWAPAMYRMTIENERKYVRSFSPCQPDVELTPVVFQIYGYGEPVYVVAGEHLDLFALWLRDRALIVGANLTFESTVILRAGGRLPRVHKDVIQMDYLGNETLRQGMHGQKEQERDHLGLDPQEYAWDDFAVALKEETEKALQYCSFDAWSALFLGDFQEHDLRGKRSVAPCTDLWDHYCRKERNLAQVVTHIDQAGLPILPEATLELAKRLDAEIEAVTARAYNEIGRPLNLSSTKDVGHYFYVERGYPVTITTDGWECLICQKKVNSRTKNRCNVHGAGALVNTPKVDESALEPIALAGDKVAATILERRGLDKQRESFVEPFWTRSSPVEGFASRLYPWSGDDPGLRVMHPALKAADVVSGRLAAPLALTIPKKGFKHQVGFHEGSGWTLIDVDFAQIELRIMAELSGDPVLLDAFDHKRDMHAWTGALVEAYLRYGQRALTDNDLRVETYELIKAAKAADKKSRTPEQERLIDRRNHGKCFHPDTEVLTRTRGWQKILDVQPGEQIAQAWPIQDSGTIELEWTVPHEVTRLRHETGELVMMKSDTLEMGLTPDHRTLVYRGDRYRVTVPELVNKDEVVMPGGHLAGTRPFTPKELAELRVAIAVQADGHYEEDGKIDLRFLKPRKIERFAELLAAANITYRKFPRGGDGKTRFSIGPGQARRVRQYLSRDKKLTWEMVDWCAEARATVLDEIVHWDSSIEDGGFRYSTKHKQCADVVQALAALQGLRSRVGADREWFRTRVSNPDRKEHKLLKLHSEVVKFEEEVACLGVESTFVLVRFRGTTFVSGQTLNFAKIYGAGDDKLAASLGVSVDEARRISAAIMMMYSGMAEYMENGIKELEQDATMLTLAGRHRTILEVQSPDPKTRAEGERLSTNQRAQCGARDALAGAKIQIDMDIEAGGGYGTEGRGSYGSWVDGRYVPDPERLPRKWRNGLTDRLSEDLGLLGRLGVRLINSIHDELLAFAPDAYAPEASARIVYLMEDPWGAERPFRCPIVAEATTGLTWQACKDSGG